jgi:hypothetical protein
LFPLSDLVITHIFLQPCIRNPSMFFKKVGKRPFNRRDAMDAERKAATEESLTTDGHGWTRILQGESTKTAWNNFIAGCERSLLEAMILSLACGETLRSGCGFSP